MPRDASRAAESVPEAYVEILRPPSEALRMTTSGNRRGRNAPTGEVISLLGLVDGAAADDGAENFCFGVFAGRDFGDVGA